MKILCTGGREYWDPHTIHYALKDLPEGTEIVHGGAEGADALVDQVAKGLGYTVYSVPVQKAEWRTYGPAAGPMRNRRMIEMHAPIDIVYAFPGGTGTEDMILAAYQNNIPVKRFGNV